MYVFRVFFYCIVFVFFMLILMNFTYLLGLAWPSSVARRASAVTVPCGTGAQSGSGPAGPTRHSNGSRSDSSPGEREKNSKTMQNQCKTLKKNGERNHKSLKSS